MCWKTVDNFCIKTLPVSEAERSFCDYVGTEVFFIAKCICKYFPSRAKKDGEEMIKMNYTNMSY